MSVRDRLETLRRQRGGVGGVVSGSPGRLTPGRSRSPAASIGAHVPSPPRGGERQGEGVWRQDPAGSAAPPDPAGSLLIPGDWDRRPELSGLADRLRRLQTRTAWTPPPPQPTRNRCDAPRLADLLGGEILAPGVVLTERRVPLTTRHGAVALRDAGLPVHRLPEGDVDPRLSAFVDTETTGLSGGSGTVVFLLGAGRFEHDAFIVRQYLLTAFGGEADLLAAAAEWITAAKTMVTFNGRTFDLPLLAARCRLAGVADRFSRIAQVDLLHPTRRAFARRWEDCRLATAERRLLRFEREDDLPGSEAPLSWFRFVRHGHATPLPRVAEHNYRDVVSLAALLPALADVHAEPGAWEADILAIARAYERAGDKARALAVLREHRSMLDADGLLQLAWLHRERNDWDEATVIWLELAARGHPEAIERLAKYHEHVVHDFAAALAYADHLPHRPDHEHRRARLRAKLARVNFLKT